MTVTHFNRVENIAESLKKNHFYNAKTKTRTKTILMSKSKNKWKLLETLAIIICFI